MYLIVIDTHCYTIPYTKKFKYMGKMSLSWTQELKLITCLHI